MGMVLCDFAKIVAINLNCFDSCFQNNRNDPHNTISRQEGHRQVRNLLQSGENIEVQCFVKNNKV